MVGGPTKEYEILSKELGIHNDIIFTGYQSNNDLHKFYAATDVCVWLPDPPGTFGMVHSGLWLEL